ncbi:cupin domain-containing protein [Bosea sp. BIWAKO-01]|uniref:cupin domain-containing protein n=1 Tax=Bosea sp. BIWAKO-01 TaxID=506668 RepID=UPI000852C1AC|nr:cupin domain-containing protein [Bosea sp. BIWAKO-01]GAU83018.1 hypothetical protein BIWAKO_02941 [Bosea sp. BIWAKO-01]
MSFRASAAGAALLAALALPAIATARSPRPGGETVKPVFRQAIPNIPGKSLVSVVVTYEPGATSTSHHHAGSAFIYAHVLSGAIRSQVDDQPARIYRTGETWFEAPGAHHKISENASRTEPARLLAVFIVDSAEEVLTAPDHQ